MLPDDGQASLSSWAQKLPKLQANACMMLRSACDSCASLQSELLKACTFISLHEQEYTRQ